MDAGPYRLRRYGNDRRAACDSIGAARALSSAHRARFQTKLPGRSHYRPGGTICGNDPRRRQLSMVLDSVRLRSMSPSERSIVVARLASLLLEAAGVAAGEYDDDEH